jgi:hypothetical protein
MPSGERTIHGITWADDLAWMESMKGIKWNSLIRKDQQRWKNLLEPLKDQVAIITSELVAAQRLSQAMNFRAADGHIDVGVIGHSVRWSPAGSMEYHDSAAMVCRGPNAQGISVWVTDDIGEGSELYAIRYYTKSKTPVWQHKGVAPQFAIVGDRCYCLEAKNKLVYWRLVSWNAFTGKDRQVHYEEKEYQYNLEIEGGDNESHAYMRRQAGGKQDCFMIHKSGELTVLEGISLDSRRFVFGSRASEYLFWTGATGWVASKELQKAGWILPCGSGAPLRRATPLHLDTAKGIMVTIWNGCRSLWSIHKKREPLLLWKGYGDVLADPWGSQMVRILQPGMDAWWVSLGELSAGTGPAAGTAKKATSADGTEVPYYLVTPVSAAPAKPKALLVIGYGAYGLQTPLLTQRWKPLLDRGWALAIGMWRGGGDHTPEWADAGRGPGRSTVLEDAEAVVLAAQKATGVSPRKTVLYGRSAGGLWVGGLVTKPRPVAAAAYMEVPYLDVLRTTTNRSLPLTNIEADEFGLPERNISEFVHISRWSPMERIPSGGIPNVFQIVRTAENDSEVYAYESVKWVTRCKGSAYLAIEGAQGHFASGSKNTEQQAQDLAVLLDKIHTQ